MSAKFEDRKIDTKIRLAACWTAVMFCYIYGDFFSLFVPGRIERLMKGGSGMGETTPFQLLLYAIMMTIPAVMIIACVTLKRTINRILNITVAALFTIIMIAVLSTVHGRWMLFYGFLGIVEIFITIGIIWKAWQWRSL